MTEWKIRQEVYHRINQVFDDDLNTKEIVLSDDITNNAVRYFTERDIGWIYPAKSYMVGICYARWLSEYFGGNPIDYLDDADLLYGNDPYFVRYTNNSTIYDQILEVIGQWQFDTTQGMVPDVRQYFEDEFMIADLT
jgi:hypothetical protein